MSLPQPTAVSQDDTRIRVMIVDDAGATKPAREAIADLVEQVRPHAEVLRCTDELDGITRILEVGSSASRQRRASDGGKNLRAVVDLLARELSTDEIAP